MKELDHAGQRVAGFCLILAGLFTMDPSASSQLHRLWIPLSMAAGALLLTRAPVAVAIAAAALCLIGMDFGGDWISAIAYPLITLAGLGYLSWRAVHARRNS